MAKKENPFMAMIAAKKAAGKGATPKGKAGMKQGASKKGMPMKKGC